ncbi:MAG: hypothetical protein ACK5P5_13425 [Pseudobdellovibrionaceae bacterium]
MGQQSYLSLFKSILISLFICMAVFPEMAQAEYRVFQLRISKVNTTKTVDAGTNKPPDETPAVANAQPEEPTFRELLSTLDPEQYRYYYPVAADEVVKYVATWRCFGRTNDRDFCPNPKAQAQNTPNP